MIDDPDEPVLSPEGARYHLVAIVVICALIAAVSWLPPCVPEPPKPPPQAEVGPWRVVSPEADSCDSGVVISLCAD